MLRYCRDGSSAKACITSAMSEKSWLNLNVSMQIRRRRVLERASIASEEGPCRVCMVRDLRDEAEIERRGISVAALCVIVPLSVSV